MNTHKLFSDELNKVLRLKYNSKTFLRFILQLSLISSVKNPHCIFLKNLRENGSKDCPFIIKKE
jgi:hypothetical protein